MNHVAKRPVAVSARVLSRFYYHGLYVPGGSSTDPSILSDTSILFGLAAAMGIQRRPRPRPAYREEITQLPWRSTLFVATRRNMVGAPVLHAVDVEREGGYQKELQDAMGSGNVKKIWVVHEVLEGAEYEGMLVGQDPFAVAASEELIIRIGVGRMGLVALRRLDALPKSVRLNTATALLFARTVPEDYRILDTIRVSRPMAPQSAQAELETWSASA